MNNNKDYQKEAINHFRLSIIDAKLSYTLFKLLYQSRAESIVGKQLFEKYFWVQKQHNIFKLIEHNAVEVFVVKILHGFDNNDNALTLRDIDEDAYAKFIEREENKHILDKIRRLRRKSVAHFDKKQPTDKKLPTFKEIDTFFINLQQFYNDLCGKIESSVTIFKQDEDLKRELEKVLKNLYVGEKIRLLNIELEYDWEKNPKKISKNEKC
ncbi:hypothetical protein KKG48_02285 [Patescibacteria group bacterium]|nr:hypothetical protein [Patescibacteria group bacterium]MCG2694852.1 hypothetical protein [Candidatus Parcubacteria bacterium]